MKHSVMHGFSLDTPQRQTHEADRDYKISPGRKKIAVSGDPSTPAFYPVTTGTDTSISSEPDLE